MGDRKSKTSKAGIRFHRAQTYKRQFRWVGCNIRKGTSFQCRAVVALRGGDSGIFCIISVLAGMVHTCVRLCKIRYAAVASSYTFYEVIVFFIVTRPK